MATNFSLESFLLMPARNDSRCFNWVSIFSISTDTSILSPRGTAYSAVPTMKEDTVPFFSATTSIASRFAILKSTELYCSKALLPTIWSESASRGEMFFWLRIVRTPPIIVLSFSTSDINAVSSAEGLESSNLSLIIESPSLRSYIFCQSSSVINGMKGWSIFSKTSKNLKVAS